MASEKDRSGRVKFLWHASHYYSTICPQLSSYLSEKLLTIAGPVPHATIVERLCPSCGHNLLPISHPSKMRIISLKKLKSIRRKSQGRKGAWLTTPLGRAKSYVIVYCVCGGSFVTTALRRKPHPPGRKPHPPTDLMKTPSSKRRRSGHSSTLKSMLEASNRQEARRRQQSSPSLSLFLKQLNT